MKKHTTIWIGILVSLFLLSGTVMTAPADAGALVKHANVDGTVLVAPVEDGIRSEQVGLSAAAGLDYSTSLILRVTPKAGQQGTVALPAGVEADGQRFKSLSALTGKDYYLVPPEQAEKVRAALEKDDCDGALQVFPNIVKHLARTLPDDPQFSFQYCHDNPENPDSDMDSTAAWDITTGSTEVVLAIIDTGVDYNHPDLAANIWSNPGEIPGNGIDDDGNGYVDDIHGIDPGENDSDPMDHVGHGTHVAGIMGAVGDNNLGVCGVNWQTKIMVLKSFVGATSAMTTAMEIEAMDYILAMKARGVNIVAVNASYFGPEDMMEKEAIEAMGEAGILFMACAGNESYNNDANPEFATYPASYDLDNIISVAASNAAGQLACFSNYGATQVDLAAPGDNILSTMKGTHTYTPAPGDLFFDDMESGNGNWTPAGTWAITAEQSNSPANAWSDSPGDDYEHDEDMALTSPVIDLSQASWPLALGFFIQYEIEDPLGDDVQIWYLAPGDPDPVWEMIGKLDGSSNGQWETISALIPERFFWADFQFRFVLHSDDAIAHDGVYIDDVGIGVPDMTYPYISYNGTSMAAPQVTGAAGLVAAVFPDLGPSEIKTRLLNGTVPQPALDGYVATGGLLNLTGVLADDPYLDSDGDGVPDFRDNCGATANAGQENADHDDWGNACDCDLNNDGVVSLPDFMLFRSYWGSDEAVADFNSDGFVSLPDFMIFRTRWGSAAPFE